MERRVFKKDGSKISLLGFGAMRLPVVGDDMSKIDYATAKRLIDKAYLAGVNYYDTAYVYHEETSEAFLAKALADYPRDRYFLTSKMPVWMLESKEDMPRIFEEQLRRCKTDYFDFYLMHSLGAKTFEKAEELGAWAFMEAMQKKGKIRRLGFSFHDTPEVLEEICSAHPWDVAQIQLNYLDWEHQRAKEQYDTLVRHSIPCIAMEPVRGGRLADLGEKANGLLRAAAPKASIASWAMRWVAALPNVLCILSGMTTLPQVEDNLKTFAKLKPFSPAEADALQEALDEFRSHNMIDCTACRYCMPCPTDVDIPGLLALRNTCIFDNNPAGFAEQYAKFPAQHNAAHCIGCRQCEKVCPQGLPIIQLLAKMREDTAAQ